MHIYYCCFLRNSPSYNTLTHAHARARDRLMHMQPTRTRCMGTRNLIGPDWFIKSRCVYAESTEHAAKLWAERQTKTGITRVSTHRANAKWRETALNVYWHWEHAIDNAKWTKTTTTAATLWKSPKIPQHDAIFMVACICVCHMHKCIRVYGGRQGIADVCQYNGYFALVKMFIWKSVSGLTPHSHTTPIGMLFRLCAFFCAPLFVGSGVHVVLGRSSASNAVAGVRRGGCCFVSIFILLLWMWPYIHSD